MSLRYAVLGVLEAGAMTGYDLSRFFADSAGWVWSAKHSQIYPLLNRLTDDGLVNRRELVRGNSQRVVEYEINDDGRAALMKWLDTEGGWGPDRDSFLVQAIFVDMLPPERAVAILESFIATQEAAAHHAHEHADALARGETPLIRERLRHRPAADHERICCIKAAAFRGRAAVAQAKVEWARELMTVIKDAVQSAASRSR